MDLEYEYGIWWDPLMVICNYQYDFVIFYDWNGEMISQRLVIKTSPQFSMVSMDAFFSQIYPKEIWPKSR